MSCPTSLIISNLIVIMMSTSGTLQLTDTLSSRYLKSTIGNIALIQKFRKHSEESEKVPEVEVFNFYMDYFSEGIQEESADITIRFPVRNSSQSSFLCETQ